jgi:hypothetical protein
LNLNKSLAVQDYQKFSEETIPWLSGIVIVCIGYSIFFAFSENAADICGQHLRPWSWLWTVLGFSLEFAFGRFVKSSLTKA